MSRLTSYAVTPGCNSKTQQRRGELRGYAVTRVSHMCVRAGVRVRAHAGVHVGARVGVTAQPRNSLGGLRVSQLRARATA